MKRRAPVLAGALLLIVLPLQALAQQTGCRTIRAMTNADRREFADLAIGLGPSALTLRGRSRAGDLEGPNECELSSENVIRDLDCRWRFYGEAEAIAFYEPLLARMRACLAEGMTEAEIATRTPGWQIMRRHETIVAAEYSQTKVELSLVDATRRSDAEATPNANYYVQLTASFEQGD